MISSIAKVSKFFSFTFKLTNRVGFNHLFDTFTSIGMSDQSETPGWRKCLPILLKIVNKFIKGNVSLLQSDLSEKRGLRHSGETMKKIVDYPSFLTMILKLIFDSSKQRLESASTVNEFMS